MGVLAFLVSGKLLCGLQTHDGFESNIFLDMYNHIRLGSIIECFCHLQIVLLQKMACSNPCIKIPCSDLLS